MRKFLLDCRYLRFQLADLTWTHAKSVKFVTGNMSKIIHITRNEYHRPNTTKLAQSHQCRGWTFEYEEGSVMAKDLNTALSLQANLMQTQRQNRCYYFLYFHIQKQPRRFYQKEVAQTQHQHRPNTSTMLKVKIWIRGSLGTISAMGKDWNTILSWKFNLMQTQMQNRCYFFRYFSYTPAARALQWKRSSTDPTPAQSSQCQG